MTNFLTRLELHGFKSFAGKTVLEFPARIVAIVGPNGSGKSNIIDALKWVLGEREAKQLRGELLENLIFAGTPQRPAVSLAKVCLYFDNQSRLLPFDLSEAVLTRKVDRSGVSQFYLNDSEIRLKDLAPLLARARLGSRGLMMVSQGESDIFVKGNGEERRLMIEEVLGLKEFRLKKNQAERRLNASQINMDKVKAMLEELLPHLRLLRRQKHRWEKRSEIEGTLKELESKYFAFRSGEIEKAFIGLTVPLKEFEEGRREKEKEIRELEKTLKEIDEKTYDAGAAKALREKLSDILNRRSVLDKELARLEAKMELQKIGGTYTPETAELIHNVKSLIHEIEETLALDDLDKVKQRLRLWLERLNRLFKREEKSGEKDFLEDAERFKKEIEKIDLEIKDLRDKEEAVALEREKINQEFRHFVQDLENKKNELCELDQKMQGRLFEKQKLQLEREELEREWQNSGYHVSDLNKLAPAEEKIDVLETQRRLLKLRGELMVIGEIDPSLVKEAEESDKRYEFLSKEIKDLEKSSADLKHLIKELEERIHDDFKKAFRSINEEFNKYFRLMFGGGRAHLKLVSYEPKVLTPSAESSEGKEGEQEEKPEEAVGEQEKEVRIGVEVELNLPKKKITSLDMLSGGERSLVSIAALFALISVSPPPFLVMDEIDAALDDENARRFAELVKEFSHKTQFIIVTHNRATMEIAQILYGVTIGEDGVSKVLSLKLE